MPDDSGARRSGDRPEDREAALRAAEAARDEAEAANRAKTEFLAVVSHEVRTPLNGILGYLDLLQSGVGGPIGEEHAEYVERARRSGKHLLMLIEEILDIALIESGQVRIEPTPGNLGDVIDGAVALVAPQAARGGIKLLNAGAGPGGGPSYLGQEDRVRQILVNLLANAVKFTDPGGSVTISAGAVDRPPKGAVAPDGAAAFVRVEDTGAGIDPERLAAIFEPTVGEERTSRPSRERRGVGLGLAISRRLARLMSGDITVASTPGIGSVFVLWLPAAAGPEGSFGEFAEEPGAIPEAALRNVGEIILKELERTLRIFVGRLRTDPRIPTAHAQDETVLEDHMATFLADLAHSLIAMDETTDAEGEHLREGAGIPSRVARRHGEQRARLGWTEDEIRREFDLLREELEAAVERRTRHAHTAKGEAVQRALTMLLERAAGESVDGLRHALDSDSESNS